MCICIELHPNTSPFKLTSQLKKDGINTLH